MRVIKSDGTIVEQMDSSQSKHERLKLIWDAMEQRGYTNPMKSNLRGVRPMRRKKTNETTGNNEQIPGSEGKPANC